MDQQKKKRQDTYLLVKKTLLRQIMEIVENKIWKEINGGRVSGPFPFPPFLDFRVSPLGLIPKKDPQ